MLPRWVALLLAFVASYSLVDGGPLHSEGNERWGYVDVRHDAHMFWWLYDVQSVNDTITPATAPLVLWLQGGPGASGVGFGNFEEIGPVDTESKARKTTWLQSVNLLFIDNPVGAGFSYVDDNKALTTNVTQISQDLLAVMKHVVEKDENLQKVPFYIFCESYGGKMTADFGAVLHRAIKDEEITMNFKGVALGDSWVSPVDSVLTWGPYLYQYNLLDGNGLNKVNELAEKCADAVDRGQFEEATDLWGDLEGLIDEQTDGVNVYNVLQHNQAQPFKSSQQQMLWFGSRLDRLYQQHVGSRQKPSLSAFMNTYVRTKLKVVPDKVRWGGQSGAVFQYQRGDFMKDVRKDVDYLLNNGVDVTVFQGQLDMICDTAGAEQWIGKLTWDHIQDWFVSRRDPLYVTSKGRDTQGFVKKYKNFQLFYIMNAGHMVPSDNGEMALKMMQMITHTS